MALSIGGWGVGVICNLNLIYVKQDINEVYAKTQLDSAIIWYILKV